MPFTPAHPAIILPLLKARRLSATGLIVGSTAPDFEYFFKFSVSSQFSHTWWGILYFNIPVAVLLSVVFHFFVKQNLINNFPDFLRARFQDTLAFDFKSYLSANFLFFVLSAALGAASHIFWDSFTHEHGYFVNVLPFYKDTIVPYDGARYPLFYALQHLSTVVGLLLVTVYILLKKKVSIGAEDHSLYRYWIFVVLVTAVVVFIRFSIHSSDLIIGNVIVSSISGFCIALVVAGLIPFTGKTKV